MPNPDVARLHEWLKAHESELLDEYRAVLQIPSVEGDPEPNAPFGRENRRALDYVLRLTDSWGMRTKDIEGYCGWAEFGSGDRLVMSLGHLDVVPVSDGWKHEPFGAEIDGEYVYARGAVDDKGPTMAALYAARAIHECVPSFPARMRSVFGCNEESGFKCIHRYNETEEAPTFGVAPDSGWPLYHAEKGIANLIVELPLIQGELQIVRVSGGQRPNIVIDSCEAEVIVQSSARDHVVAKLADSWDRNVHFDWSGNERLLIRAKGKACHGAWPFGGDSAAIRLFRFLAEIAPLSVSNEYTALFESTHVSGPGLGIHGADDVSGDLTNNLGIVETVGDRIRLTFNVRYPVTWTGSDLKSRCEKHLAELDLGFVLAQFSDSKPLYFPLDHPLVRAVCEVYEEETGEKTEPGTMGGGTYARAVANTVSIGTGWDGDGAAHENDERLKIEHLYKMSRIYAHIFWRLGTMPAQ